MRTGFWAVGAVAIGTAATSYAQPSKFSVDNWEVVGVRLEMNSAQAEAALRERGYTITRKSMMQNFEERVQSALGKTVESATAVYQLEAMKGLESVSIKFRALPSGTAVQELWYRVPAGQVSASTAIAALTQRVGPPPAKRSAANRAVWCKDGSDPRYCDRDGPSLSVGSSDNTLIHMDAGLGLFKKQEADVAAAAQASPNRIKPTF